MANHKSSLKRIRQEEKRRLHNRYYAKTMRNTVKKLRATTDKAEAVAMYPGVQKMLDKLAKTNIIHKNKAANLLKQSLKLKDKIGRIFQSGLLSFYVFHKTQAIHIANVTSKKYAIPRSAENSPEESEAFMKDLEENHT